MGLALVLVVLKLMPCERAISLRSGSPVLVEDLCHRLCHRRSDGNPHGISVRHELGHIFEKHRRCYRPDPRDGGDVQFLSREHVPRSVPAGRETAWPRPPSAVRNRGLVRVWLSGFFMAQNARIAFGRNTLGDAMTRRRRTGILMLVAAFVPYAIAVWHVSRHNWTPLDYLVQLHRGEVRTLEFLAETSGTYILFLQVQPRILEFQRQEMPPRPRVIPSTMLPRDSLSD